MNVRHELGFTLEFPDDWHITQNPSPDIALVGTAPPDETGFSRNIAVTVGTAGNYGNSMDAWHEDTLEPLVNGLDDAQLIDKNVESDSFRRLISYVAGTRAVTLEQWVRLWNSGGRVLGVTISATTPSLDYPSYSEEMNDIAWSWAAESETNS
jgi:hypothetical protein